MGWFFFVSILIPTVAWGAAAVWFDGPESRALSGLLVSGFSLAQAAVVVFARPLRRAWMGAALLFVPLLLWWLSLAPSNDREWQAEVARPPRAVIEGERVTIENVRNFAYRGVSEFEERWATRSYDLTKLEGVDLFLSYWGSPHIAHTIVSWQFADSPPLSISIETRKEVGESYSALRGFFRQFELYYVVADETDLIRQRTDFRKEAVYLYRLATEVETARAILLDYLEEINALAEEPRWYNAATHNCTTTIRMHAQHVAPANPWDWRILVNGYIDELGYERGQIASDLAFAELRKASRVDERARAMPPGEDFSGWIRAQLPARGKREEGEGPR